MIVLGLESSCDETGAAVVDGDGLVLSDVVQSQAVHAEYGGIVPELASRDHTRNVMPVVERALAEARVKVEDLDAIAVTCRPGLVGALLVGVQAAKGMAWASGKPLVGVDHLLGHLLAVFLRRAGAPPPSVPRYPFVALLASGGHTAIYSVHAPDAAACTELGATRDDAAGEAFDKVAKLLGLGYPGGPVIDRLAERGDAARFRLEAPMRHTKTFEFSFSGLKTRVARDVEARGLPKSESELQDLCASFQAAVTEVLSEKLVAAALSEGAVDVVLAGGVAANRELRARTAALAAKHGLVAHVPPPASCTDNAAMIAYAGLQAFLRGERDGLTLKATSATSLARATRKGRGRR
ncbi:MAG: tRNA (adenosine(37)-N6)-threonylcarbamoyltransferase complex transferase subunit TsaD [Myxococcales bacterium]|nr:tRNA (adenosine(37)-N6)-threonylcarbamoyltransferase complex transferase subunit TsaD [Myxococcales bacterium]